MEKEGLRYLAGFLEAHRDNFKHVNFLIPVTLGIGEGDIHFYKEKGTEKEWKVSIRVPHGTVVAMLGIVAGANHNEKEGNGLYWLEVTGADGAYLLGLQFKLVEEVVAE